MTTKLRLIAIPILFSLINSPLLAQAPTVPDIAKIKKRSAAGDPAAKVQLADFSRQNLHGIPYHGPSIFRAYTLGAKANIAKAHYGLAICYRHSIGTKFNPRKCYENALKSSELGNSDGKRYLGVCYSLGFHKVPANSGNQIVNRNIKVTKKDLDKAIATWNECGNAGDQRAFVNIANTYLYNSKTFHPHNRKQQISIRNQGLKIVEKLAKDNNPHALALLGDIYIAGNFGYPAHTFKAIAYHKKAAKLGNFDSLHQIGGLYSGMGDTQKALKYFKLAAKRDYPISLGQLALYYRKNPDKQETPNQWLNYAIRLANLGYSRGHELLGLHYSDSSNPSYSRKKAYHHFVLANKLDNWLTYYQGLKSESLVRVAKLLEHGWEKQKANPKLAASFIHYKTIKHHAYRNREPLHRYLANLIATNKNLQKNKILSERAIKHYSFYVRASSQKSKAMYIDSLKKILTNSPLNAQEQKKAKETATYQLSLFPNILITDALNPDKVTADKAIQIALFYTPYHELTYTQPCLITNRSHDTKATVRYYQIAWSAMTKEANPSIQWSDIHQSIFTIAGIYRNNKLQTPWCLNEPKAAVNLAYRFSLSKKDYGEYLLLDMLRILSPIDKSRSYPQIEKDQGIVLAYYHYLLRQKHCGKIKNEQLKLAFKSLNATPEQIAEATKMLTTKKISDLPYPRAKDYFSNNNDPIMFK